MKTLTSNQKRFALAFGALLLVIVVLMLAAALFGGNSDNPDSQPETNTEAQRLSITDIENVFVHIGLDIDCPDLRGVAQNGYVYSVVLAGKETAIERIGCGVGEPEIFAAAIAEDLERNGNFSSIPQDQFMDKMSFKFYDISTE